ncbi:WG repeat-containing protein [Nostoc sp. B(2019)]|nr:WG repeat-containing protein [Nostoc sp. B(2019)]
MTNPQNQQKFKLGKALIIGVTLLTGLGIFQIALSQLLLKQTAPKVNFAIQPQFDYASPFSEEMARVKIGNKWGYINKTGKLVIPAKFDGYPVDGAIYFSLSFMDKHHRSFRYSGNFSQGLAPVQVGNKWGYIDKRGRMVIPPKFACADDFSEGLAAVGNQGMYINQKGQAVFTHQFGCNSSKFFQGLALIGRDTIINKKGKVVYHLSENFGSESPLSGFSENLLVVNKSNNFDFGFLDREGKIVIKPQFHLAYPFSEGLALVRNKPTGSRSGFGFINKTGKFVIPPNLIIPASFSQGLAPFCMGESACGYIDKSGKVVIQTQFADVSSFSENIAPVKVGNKWGYIYHPFKR